MFGRKASSRLDNESRAAFERPTWTILLTKSRRCAGNQVKLLRAIESRTSGPWAAKAIEATFDPRRDIGIEKAWG